jgi:hypothetical protein
MKRKGTRQEKQGRDRQDEYHSAAQAREWANGNYEGGQDFGLDLRGVNTLEFQIGEIMSL